MKKTVLTFGLISGLIISVLMGGSLLLANKIGSGHSMTLGYTIMVASFLLIYFGIRSYRDNTLSGEISFGRAFACGILITLITTVCYVVMCEVLYLNPLINMAYTIMEPLPVGLVITLISAALLRRKAPTPTNSSADPALA